MHLIPAIDLQDGQCVRLREGLFDERTDYDVDPIALIRRYALAGAPWVHVVDLDGARSGRPAQTGLIAEMAAVPGVRLQVGGGLRSEADVRRALLAGASRVVLGSAALEDPQRTHRWLAQLGRDRVVIALDVRLDASGCPRVRTHGWTVDSTAAIWDVLAEFASSDLRHLLCTDIARDGTLGGPNLALYRELCSRFPDLAVQASGGVAGARDLQALRDTGVTAAIAGKALLDGRLSLQEAAPFLPNA